MTSEDKIQQLVDRAAIANLQSEYAYRFDSHDLDGVVELYAPDGSVSVGDDEPVRGRDALRAMYGDLDRVMGEWAHHYSNSWIELTSPTTARGRLYWLMPANWSDGRAHLQSGRYEDRYVKIDDRWYIQQRSASWHWSRYMEWAGNWSQTEPLT